MKKILSTLFLSAALLMPAYATLSSTAQAATTCQFDQQSTRLCNPLPDNNLDSIIVRGLKYILGLIGSVAVVVIVIAGFKMVASQGNSEAIKGAKDSIKWAVIGLAVAFLAYTMVAIVSGTLKGSAN